MAGSGVRFGSALPKQYHHLSGKKVYLHTLEKMIQSNLFHEILLVCSEDWRAEVAKDISNLPQNISVIVGGRTRQESSYRALISCKQGTEFVLIHDAVRPFVSIDILNQNLEALKVHNAVDTCISCTDTIVHAPGGELIQSIPERSHYLRGQTPQSFSYNLILKAHKAALQDQIFNATDDCQLVLRLGASVHIVKGEESNHKITSELDLFLAEQTLRLEQKKWNAKGNVSLNGKVFAVTGGNGGIGSAIVDKLKEHNAIPIVVSRSSGEYSADLTDSKQVEVVFERIYKDYGTIDGLINSAGYLQARDFENLSLDEIENMIDVNLRGVVYSCKYARIKEGGHILNISSSSYVKGRQGLSVYSATKAAVVNFTQALAEEMPSFHINALVPKRTDTPMRHANFIDDPKELLLPETIAKTTLDVLCSKGITGNIVNIRQRSETPISL